MKFRQTNRLFLKIFFSWLIVFLVLFLWYDYVNIENHINKEISIKDSKKDKNISEKSLDNLKQEQIIKESKIANIIKKKRKTNKGKEISEYTKNKFLLDLYKQVFSNKHNSALSEDTHARLCRYYAKYCWILDLDENLSYNEKVYYSVVSIYLLRFLHWIFPNTVDDIYYIKLQKKQSWRRGYAWHHTIIMNIKDSMSYQEFLQVLTHELWHVVDLWFVKWNRLPKSTRFKEFWNISFYQNDPSLDFYSISFLSEKVKKPHVYAKDFVSWYWMSDIFEDFAECFNMYVNHNFVFIKMSRESNILKKKYNYINKLMKWKYIKSWNQSNYNYWYRPWDTTKLKN